MAPIFITIQNLNILQLPLYSNHTKSHCTGASLVGDVTTVNFQVQVPLALRRLGQKLWYGFPLCAHICKSELSNQDRCVQMQGGQILDVYVCLIR